MELVTVNNGSPVTTTLAIAEGLEVNHKAIIQLVRTYQADLERFGLVTFEMAPRLPGQHGGGDTEFAELNERQATLIMTYAKNTAIARTFKMRLVEAFYELASKALTPVTPQLQLAHAMLLAGQMIEDQKIQIEQRDKLISIVAPKAAIADRIEVSDGLFGFRQIAKILSINENKLRAWLIQNDWIYYLGGRMTAKAPKLRSGHLDSKVKLIQIDGHDDKTIVDMFFTAKGLHKLTGIFCQAELQEAA